MDVVPCQFFSIVSQAFTTYILFPFVTGAQQEQSLSLHTFAAAAAVMNFSCWQPASLELF
jgi:hypothetical protein